MRDDKQWNGGAKASKLNHEGKKVVREVLSQASSQHIENEPNEGLEQIATHHPSAPSKEGHGVPEDEKEVQDKKETSDKTAGARYIPCPSPEDPRERLATKQYPAAQDSD